MKARIRPMPAQPPLPPPSLQPQRGTAGMERLAVYAEGYVARMREALAECYEAVAHLLGREAFAQLALDYARAYPSHDYNLSFAGRHLPDFLPTWPKTRELPFVPDLARLEWAVCEAFHAFEQPTEPAPSTLARKCRAPLGARPPSDSVRLASLTLDEWERVRLVFQPSVRVMCSDWPILDLWQARRTPREQIDLALADRPQQVLVRRDGVQVRCELLDAPQAETLTGLLEGRHLGEICERLAVRRGEDTPLPVTAWFARWSGLGLIAAIHTPGV